MQLPVLGKAVALADFASVLAAICPVVAFDERGIDRVAGALCATLCRRVEWAGQRFRALNHWNPDDFALLKAVSRGDYLLNGFRNRDLNADLLGPPPTDALAPRKRAAKVTRKIRLLRAHGLLKKVIGTQPYLLTAKGRRITSALLAAHDLTPEQLRKCA